MDSPGYCAEYCTYTAMDDTTKNILDIAVVNKKTTELNSVIMEKQGLEKVLKNLVKKKKVRISEIATDAHCQIRAMIGK